MPTLTPPGAHRPAMDRPATHPRRFQKDRIFHLEPPHDAKGGLLQKLYARSVPSLERVLGLDKINAVYSYGSAQTPPHDFISKSPEYLPIHCPLAAEDPLRIPTS